MKTGIFLLLICLSSTTYLKAQSLELQVIGAAGTYQTASWGSLSSTTGESLTNTLAASKFVFTQGFQQPLISELAVTGVLENGTRTNVFPVPADEDSNIVIDQDNFAKHYSVTLYDVLGQVLKLSSQTLISGTETKFVFDLRPLANAAYFIVIRDEHNTVLRSIPFNKVN